MEYNIESSSTLPSASRLPRLLLVLCRSREVKPQETFCEEDDFQPEPGLSKPGGTETGLGGMGRVEY